MFSGKCSECDANVRVSTEQDYKKLNFFITKGKDNVVHNKRRKLTGETKAEVRKRLETHESAYVIKSSMAKTYTEIGKCAPVFLPSEKQITQLKYKDNLDNCYDINPIKSLQIMKYAHEYKDCIHFIGADPFYVIYWHPYQVRWYQQYCRNETPIITLDATGSVVYSPKHADNSKTKHTFLYNIMAISNLGTSKPIGHMLTQDNTSNFIAFMLSEMFKKIFKMPKQIVSDNSPALLAASVKVFTTCYTLKNYIDKCFQILIENEGYLECYIRLDVSHFVKNVVASKCFNDTDSRVKFFFKCCIGAIVNSSCFDKVKQIVKHVATLASNKYFGEYNGKMLPAEYALLELNKIIAVNGEEQQEKNDNKDEEDEQDEPENYPNDHDDSDIKCTEFSKISWVLDIFKNISIASKFDNNSRPNLYYNPKFLAYFKKLLETVPLWSSIMNFYFNEKNCMPPTSASCESSFKNTKHLIFKNHSLPIRPDRFVEIHLNSLEGILVSAVSDQTERKNNFKSGIHYITYIYKVLISYIKKNYLHCFTDNIVTAVDNDQIKLNTKSALVSGKKKSVVN